ncbi:hypothetical protein [Prosthecobacter sp.]|uniref:hypothetical protein n=1 Tax=Prosthecobacter sp. TaxID=1965333 RepID=UPI001DA8EB04|nr:hypothetical protein [Prosthecobacter sp.]MCB1276626.1 hypothetical protein [Prosthecobacter sp.]
MTQQKVQQAWGGLFRRSSPWLVCQFAMMLLSVQFVSAQTRSKTEIELGELLDTYYSDFNTQEDFDKAAHELATRPEFKPMLFEMLQREYFQTVKGVDRTPIIESLGPLTLRKDLSREEQKLFTDEMERLISAPPKEYSFVNGGIHLLAHYPSPEHEDLVLRFLDRQQNQDYTFVAAFKTLSVIGGPKSLEAMRRVATRFRNGNPSIWFLPELDNYIATLETRLKQKAPSPKPPASSSATKPPAKSTTPPSSASKSSQ